MSKHEWRKKEKQFYMAKALPEVFNIPEFTFAVIDGAGNPNSDDFANRVQALFAISYGLKMALKKQKVVPSGYIDYAVYPLEGVWDLNEKAKSEFTGIINKDDLVYKLMIRQPNFVTMDFYLGILDKIKSKKNIKCIDDLRMEKISDEKCIQMLHVGSYDEEPRSFAKMEEFARKKNLARISKSHREIYLSDFRKVAPEKLKTVLRFKVK